jgi:hypothetical protein
MAGNSNIQLSEIVDDASSLGDVSPALATGGFSNAPALSIATDVMQAIINGGPGGQAFNWKWNRFNVPVFTTISYQQDYYIPGLVNLGWIESAWASYINQTSLPKEKQQVEVRKDLEVTYDQTGYPGKVCWLPNDFMQSGTWGAKPLGPTPGFPSGDTTSIGNNMSGLQNPGPGVIYTSPFGTLQQPMNATTAITDPNGNLWCLTGYGTCGMTEPVWPTNPVYPTIIAPKTVATTVQDGTAVWTAINPKGMGFRLSPIPPQSGVVWAIQVVAQMKAPRFKSLSQTLEPIPDDYATHFKQGFFAECYRRNPDPKIRAKYQMERQIFMDELDKAVKQGDREMDDFGFYPSQPIMETGCGMTSVNPAEPYGAWAF